MSNYSWVDLDRLRAECQVTVMRQAVDHGDCAVKVVHLETGASAEAIGKNADQRTVLSQALSALAGKLGSNGPQAGTDDGTNAEEPRYTLAEARRELAAELCDALGHQPRIAYRGRAPVTLFCERCYWEWDVVPCRHREDEAASPQAVAAGDEVTVAVKGRLMAHWLNGQSVSLVCGSQPLLIPAPMVESVRRTT